MLDDAEVARILAITAHPDDVDFSAAGTIARWTDAGIEVAYRLVTDGDAGGFDEDFPRAEIAALRAHESQTAHMDDLEERVRGMLTRGAVLGQLPEGRLAESFQVLETP